MLQYAAVRLVPVIEVRGEGSGSRPNACAGNRKRKWHSKVATGCLRCKARRISKFMLFVRRYGGEIAMCIVDQSARSCIASSDLPAAYGSLLIRI
jgi:hypothetical protein